MSEEKKPRKFFKQHILVEVLSEDVPLEWDNLEDIQRAIDDECSGSVTEISCDEVDAATMAKLLIEQASSPEFFSLTADGKEFCREED